MKMKKGITYTRREIMKYSNENDFWWYDEIGDYAIGKYFIVLSHYKENKTISFVLTGEHSIFECICIHNY